MLKAESLAFLEGVERALKSDYVDGRLDRTAFNHRLFEIHAMKSETAEAGPCACPACREVREIEGGAEL